MKKARAVDQTALDYNPQKELVTLLQAKVGDWVALGCPDASELSRLLLRYWFGGAHPMSDGKGFFLWRLPSMLMKRLV